MNATIFWLALVLLGLLAGTTLGAVAEKAPGAKATSAPFLLSPARVLDTTNGQTHAGWSVLVKGNQIAAVGPVAKVKIPKGARVVDVTGRTIMPGMISAHSHLGLVLEGKNRDDAYTRDNVMKSLNQYEQYGVTGIISMVSIAI